MSGVKSNCSTLPGSPPNVSKKSNTIIPPARGVDRHSAELVSQKEVVGPVGRQSDANQFMGRDFVPNFKMSRIKIVRPGFASVFSLPPVSPCRSSGARPLVRNGIARSADRD